MALHSPVLMHTLTHTQEISSHSHPQPEDLLIRYLQTAHIHTRPHAHTHTHTLQEDSPLFDHLSSDQSKQVTNKLNDLMSTKHTSNYKQAHTHTLTLVTPLRLRLTVCALSVVCSTRLRRVSYSFCESRISWQGNSVGLWKNAMSGYKRLGIQTRTHTCTYTHTHTHINGMIEVFFKAVEIYSSRDRISEGKVSDIRSCNEW